MTRKSIRAAPIVLTLLALAAVHSAAANDATTLGAGVDSRVTLLGTGTPVPNPRQMGQSILVEVGDNKLLFDCGRGCAHRLWNITPGHLHKTHHVFLTHLHSDHTSGMADFYINGWGLGRSKPLEIVGPKKTDELMRHLRLAYDQDIAIRVDLQTSGLTRFDKVFIER